MYTLSVEFEWDEAKREQTLEERGIDFASVANFEWDDALSSSSDRRGESRWAAIGYIGNRLHHVVYTQRGARRRVISLRRANSRERRQYEYRD